MSDRRGGHCVDSSALRPPQRLETGQRRDACGRRDPGTEPTRVPSPSAAPPTRTKVRRCSSTPPSPRRGLADLTWPWRRPWPGVAAAGAAGTTALNAVTYLDMAARGRPASSTPEDTVEKIAGRAGLDIPGDQDTRSNRLAGLASLTGLGVGVGVGAAFGAARWLGWRPAPVTGAVVVTLGALVAGNVPMTVLGATDPRTWAVNDWVADMVPHLAYGAVTAAVLDRLDAH